MERDAMCDMPEHDGARFMTYEEELEIPDRRERRFSVSALRKRLGEYLVSLSEIVGGTAAGQEVSEVAHVPNHVAEEIIAKNSK